jgi:hypothetical protein
MEAAARSAPLTDPNGTPPAPPPAPQVKLPADFFACYMLADMAVHMLNGMSGQASFVGRTEEAQVFAAFAAQLAQFRDQVRNNGAKTVILAGPGDLPTH